MSGWPTLDLVTILIFSCLPKKSLITSELEPLENMKVVGNCLRYPGHNFEGIWTSKTPDMGQALNSVQAVGQIWTSLLLLQFGLENGLFKSLAPHESCRPMSYLSIHIK